MIPSPPDPLAQPPRGDTPVESRQLDVARILTPVRRAIGLGRVARSAAFGFGAGALLGVAVLGVEHIRSFDHALPLAVAAAIVGVLAGTAFGIARWPEVLEAARAADLHFQLDDRLTTALELHESHDFLAVLQRHDAAVHTDGLPLTESRGRWLGGREGAAIALVAVAFATAVALGTQSGSHHTAAAAAPEARRVQHTAAAQLKQLTARLQQGLTPAQLQSSAMRRLNLALATLRRELQKSSSAHSALRSISMTQQQLQHLAAGLHPINAKAVAQLNGSLNRYLGKGRPGNGTKASSRSAQATAQALNRLAQSLAHLSAAQRAALARALARAANTASDSSLRSSLRQAGSSLSNNDPQSATAALQRAAQALSQTPSAQAALSRLGAAGSRLDSLKNQLSGVTGTVPGTIPGKAPRQGSSRSQSQGKSNKNGSGLGTGSQPGKGQGKGLGLGKGQGNGSGRRFGIGSGRGRGRTGQGRGTGTGQGSKAGRGQGQGQGSNANGGAASGSRPGVSGGHGSGGRGRTARTRRGQNVTVYIPVRQGKGKEIVQTGPNGAPQQGAVVPYQQVVGQYAQSAHQALDRTSLPPALQGYVRRYFSTVSQ